MQRIVLEVSDRRAALIKALASHMEEVTLTSVEPIEENEQLVSELESGVAELNQILSGQAEGRDATDLLDELRRKNS